LDTDLDRFHVSGIRNGLKVAEILNSQIRERWEARVY
jgi:hypothetical protein